MKQNSGLNIILASKNLIALSICITILMLYVVYNQLRTRPLKSVECSNNTTCFSLTHGLNLARDLAFNFTSIVRTSGETQLEDEVTKICQLPDPHDNKSSKFYDVFAALRVLIPKDFHPKFKNPCWYSSFSIPLLKGKIEKFYNESLSLYDLMKFKNQDESKTLHCLPYFYIAGFPRSGTTALYSLISHHPQFAEPVHKEIHWLTHSKFDSMFPNNLKSVMRYIYHFDRAAEKIEQNVDLVTCDASASTMWDGFFHSNQASGCEVPLLLSYILPDAKYVVMLRNPVDRLFSDFWYHCAMDYKMKEVITNGPRMFHQSVDKALDSLISCKSHHSPLQCMHLWQEKAKKGRCYSANMHASLYYLHIIKWFSVIPHKQFLFIKSEDMFHNPREVLKKVFEFLDLPLISNKATVDNSLLKFAESSNENIHKEYHDQNVALLNETKLLLSNFFKSYNRNLANLLQDKRFLWDDV